MDEPIVMKDRWGNDATPFCMDDEFDGSGSSHGLCSAANICPGFYEGCYRDLMRMRHEETARKLGIRR